ncbi:MAG: tetratricopeptide repeat protein [Verrucomicrobiales bacterium]
MARSEYATALNRYPDTPQAQDAKFGIGETYMEQKIYDQAEEIFGELAKSPQPATRLRAEFLRGVLAGRKGDRDDARLIFRDVLGSMPDVELADRALYQLAEIYGQEKRYLDQLELLRTVGRLSRQSKRWHDPRRALSIIVQDTDLGISRGNSRIPVSIKAEPGGDTEEIFLNSGGAGKGLFVGEIPTALGAAQPGDGVLQVLGADVIGVDYPDEFKKQFRFQVLSQNEIRIASDAEFDMASARIIKEGEETITDRINAEIAAEDSDPRKSAARPPSEVKPGNPIYFRVEDPDRSLSAEADEVSVKLAASSGDEVGAVLRETGPASGVFEGSVETGELPAGATATDSAIGRSPLMAIDNDPATSWLSEPDGVAPKAIAADMKEVREVAKIRISSPDAEKQAPKRMRLFGSHDGRFWYPLAAFPAPENPPAEVPGTDGAMKLRVFNTDNPRRTNWSEMVTMAKEAKPIDEAGEVEKLVWMPKPAAEGEKIEGNAAAMWTGKFVQPRDGAVRFVFSATAGAVMVDGAWVMPPTVAEGTGPLIADAFLKQGVHRLMIYAAAPREEGIAVERARENPNTPSVTVLPFQKEDFDLAAAQEAGLADAAAPEPAKVAHEGANWDFEIAPAPLRHVRAVVDEYSGEAVAISQIEISGAGGTYLPVEADLLALARNNVLEIAPGDTVTGTFIDLVGAEGAQRNRALTRTLSATYFNGQILPVGFDFLRAGGGSVTEIRKELLRIDPGERIVVEITDYDEDRTGGKDELAAEAEVGGQKVALTAVETGETTGVFRAELDTYDAAGAAPAEASEIPRIAVKRGDRLYLRYQDAENTFPGNAAFREAEVIVRTPTPGAMRIVESRAIPAAPDSEAPPQFAFLTQPPTGGAPKGVCYEVPLTIEVIDPDAAKDTRSRVMVELTGEGAPVTVACEISAAFSEAEEALAEERNPALRQGRFIGQVRLRLGGSGSPAMLPLGDDMPASTIGAVIQKSDEDAEIEPESGRGGRRQVMVPVLNVNGSTEIRARYADAERPGADAAVEIGDAARLLSEGALAITDPDYELDAGELAMGERLYLRVRDADLDVSDDRDRAMVHISVGNGEEETVELEETLGHSGVFTASFALEPNGQPTKGNLAAAGADAAIEGFFGQALKAAYLDQRPASQSEPLAHEAEVPIAVGTDGLLYAFSKVYGDEELAVQTQFHIAESYFELFKGHLRIGRDAEAQADLKAGRRTLRELAETFPSPKYAPRIEYLLGNFSQEMKDWDAAIASYRRITRDFPEHPLASDAQYKLGQCYEEADRLDEALESYVTLAATYPDSPLIANVMIRINERFYQAENYVIAAQVARKFLDRFESHEWAPRMGFRIGQCLYKGEQYAEAGDAFDEFVKRFPDDELTPQGLFWAGESFRMVTTSRSPSAATTAAAGTSPNPTPPNTRAAASPCPRCSPSSSARRIWRTSRDGYSRGVVSVRRCVAI